MIYIYVRNGENYLNILKLTDCFAQTLPYYPLSLASRHELCPVNLLTSSHRLYTHFNLPLFATYIAAIALVSYKLDSPVLVLFHLDRMHAAPPTKRSRSGAARPSTSHHSTPASNSTTARDKIYVNPNRIEPMEKARLAEELRENRYRDSVCTMCSDTSFYARHHHFSSTSIRRMFMTENNKDKTYLCPVCKSLEPVNIPATETRKVVLAGSTLYGVWDYMPPSSVHFDIDSIVGGRVRDMTRALQRNYLHMPNRLEVIVVAGINNIGGEG